MNNDIDKQLIPQENNNHIILEVLFKKYLFLLLFGIIAGLLLGVGLTFYKNNSRNYQKPTNSNNEAEIASTPIITSIKPYPTLFSYKPNNNVPDVNVYYQDNGSIFSLNLKTGKIDTLIQSNEEKIHLNVHLSHKKDKLSYVTNEDRSEIDNDGVTIKKTDILMRAYIYDLKTKKSELIKLEEVNYSTQYGGAGWSPDDTLLLIDSGTSIYRGIRIIDIKSKQEITNFSNLGSSVTWLNNHEFIYVTESGIMSPTDYYCPCNIVRFDTATKTKKIIKQATNEMSYSTYGITDSNDLIYEKSTFPPIDQKKYSFTAEESTYYSKNTTITYWRMDAEGNEEEIKNLNDVAFKYNQPIIKVKVGNITIDSEKQQLYFTRLSSDPDWVIFRLSDYDNEEYSGIYVLNIKNPKQTLTKIFSKNIGYYDW